MAKLDFTALNELASKGKETVEGQTSAHKKDSLLRESGGADYKALYRAAHDFHQRNNPPVIDREYWRMHPDGIADTPEAEIAYWMSAADDLTSTANAYKNDPFLTGLLMTIYEELEREYKALRKSALLQASEAG